MTHQFHAFGIALNLTILTLPSLGSELLSTSDSFVSCSDASKAVPESHHVFGADENMELLALRLSPGPYSDRAVYERLVRDVSAIRAIEKRVELIRYHSPYVGPSLLVSLTPDALAQAKQGRYQAWNCLNSYLGASVIDRSQLGYMEVRVPGPYKLEVLAESYSKLVGVTLAEPSRVVGDGSSIYVTRHGADWAYVFDLAGGDCPSGCTTHEMYYFEVSADGRALEMGAWKDSGEETPRWVKPRWVKSYFRQYH